MIYSTLYSKFHAHSMYYWNVSFAGWLYDITGNYDVPFYVGGFLQVLSGFVFFLIYMAMKSDRMHAKEQSFDDEMADIHKVLTNHNA